ncbi:hypothetical protein EON66_09720 [archaeon]|nr:MAG: hypothetical protein EON66_09720 [archaeon]
MRNAHSLLFSRQPRSSSSPNKMELDKRFPSAASCPIDAIHHAIHGVRVSVNVTLLSVSLSSCCCFPCLSLVYLSSPCTRKRASCVPPLDARVQTWACIRVCVCVCVCGCVFDIAQLVAVVQTPEPNEDVFHEREHLLFYDVQPSASSQHQVSFVR